MPEIVGRLRTPRLSAAPSSPVVGEMYYDTGANVLYWWNGTGWISASGALDLKYDGAWVAGTYNDGDIVVGADGITYMCVVNGTTTAPVPWATGVSPGAPTYGTTLPASPVNGQEAILVDSITAPTYEWRFRYNANNSSIYKWEYIGGTAKHVIGTDASPWTTNPTGIYLVLPSGPTFVYPRAGEYVTRFGAAFFGNASGFATVYTMYMRVFLNTTPTATTLAGYTQVNPTANASGSATMGYSFDIITAAQLVAGVFIQIYSTAAIAQSIVQPYLDIEPRRVA